MVASSDSRTDGDQRGFGVLLGQVHGDLTRLSHFAGSFGRIEALDVDMQEVAETSMMCSIVISFWHTRT